MSATDRKEKNSTDTGDGAPVKSGRDSDSAGNKAPGSLLPLLSILISFAALAAAAWVALQLVAMQEVPTQLNRDASDIAGLTTRLDRMAETAEEQRQELEDLVSPVKSVLRVIPELSARIEHSEQQIAGLPGIDARSRTEWLKAEALYYLRIANAQAVLVGNAQVAARALQLADDKLRETGDPSFTPARAKLAEDLATLQAVPVVDRTGIVLRLQSLAAQVDEWPFRSTAPGRFAPEIEIADAAAEGQDAWDRFIATVKEVLNSIISVKETDAPRIAQLGSTEKVLISESVKAELQVARLALISGSSELFSHSLGRLIVLIDTNFNADAAAVTAALDTLSELEALELPGPLPDVSGSLSLMLATGTAAANEAGRDEP